jgi:hypothetical protein
MSWPEHKLEILKRPHRDRVTCEVQMLDGDGNTL